jgi:nucleotidyltransferase substrate binding protein (TIGR01987 family)
MTIQDVRWIQRFNHLTKALSQLRKFIQRGNLSELEEQGLVQVFKYTYELAWNTLKDYFESQGETEIHGSRDSFRLAFQRGIIEDGETWMEMVRSRTLTSHTYNEEIAKKIVKAISSQYVLQFVELHEKLDSLKGAEQ